MEITAIFKGHTDATEGVAKNGNAWRKVVAVFQTIEHYPKDLALTCMNAMCETAIQCTKGKLYRVRFDIESRPWTGSDGVEKWFTDLKCWGITAEVPAVQPQPTQQPQPSTQQKQLDFGGPMPEGLAPTDDLPY